MRVLLVCILLCWLAAGGASARGAAEELNRDQVQALIAIEYHLRTLDDLQQRGVLPAATVSQQKAYYLSRTRPVVGSTLDQAQLMTMVERHRSLDLAGTVDRVRGFFTFVNTIWVLASLLLVVAVSWLVRLYLLPLLKLVPASAYEVLAYAACLAFLIAGRRFAPGIDHFVALPGCLGLAGALAFTHYLHWKQLEPYYKSPRRLYYVNALLLFVAWAAIALLYQSELVGFMAVMALEASLGFTVMAVPLCYFIGFPEKSVIPRAMAASLFLLVFYVVVRIFAIDLHAFRVFATGVLFMGTFVYFIGVLIVSSRFYSKTSLRHYLGLQALAIVSGLLALLVGSVWQIPQLQGVGGTLFMLYLLEKYMELPWDRRSRAWAALGLALILYLCALVIRQYPGYFFL